MSEKSGQGSYPESGLTHNLEGDPEITARLQEFRGALEQQETDSEQETALVESGESDAPQAIWVDSDLAEANDVDSVVEADDIAENAPDEVAEKPSVGFVKEQYNPAQSEANENEPAQEAEEDTSANNAATTSDVKPAPQAKAPIPMPPLKKPAVKPTKATVDRPSPDKKIKTLKRGSEVFRTEKNPDTGEWEIRKHKLEEGNPVGKGQLFITEDKLDKAGNVSIEGVADSWARKFAKEHNVPVRPPKKSGSAINVQPTQEAEIQAAPKKAEKNTKPDKPGARIETLEDLPGFAPLGVASDTAKSGESDRATFAKTIDQELVTALPGFAALGEGLTTTSETDKTSIENFANDLDKQLTQLTGFKSLRSTEIAPTNPTASEATGGSTEVDETDEVSVPERKGNWLGEKYNTIGAYIGSRLFTRKTMKQNENESDGDYQERQTRRGKITAAIGAAALTAGVLYVGFKYGTSLFDGIGDGGSNQNTGSGITDSIGAGAETGFNPDVGVNDNSEAAESMTESVGRVGNKLVDASSSVGSVMDSVSQAADGAFDDLKPEFNTTDNEFNAAEYIAEHGAGAEVEVREGWYSTFADFGIDSDNHQALLQEIGPQLKEMGVAMDSPDGSELWISQSGELPTEASELIVSTAEVNGWLDADVAPTEMPPVEASQTSIAPEVSVEDLTEAEEITKGGGIISEAADYGIADLNHDEINQIGAALVDEGTGYESTSLENNFGNKYGILLDSDPNDNVLGGQFTDGAQEVFEDFADDRQVNNSVDEVKDVNPDVEKAEKQSDREIDLGTANSNEQPAPSYLQHEIDRVADLEQADLLPSEARQFVETYHDALKSNQLELLNVFADTQDFQDIAQQIKDAGILYGDGSEVIEFNNQTGEYRIIPTPDGEVVPGNVIDIVNAHYQNDYRLAS